MEDERDYGARFQSYFQEKVLEVHRIPHLGNNLLFKITLDSATRLAKVYSSVHINNWNRGECEFNSLKNLHEAGFNEIPEPIAFIRDQNIGIYSYEEGSLLPIAEVNKAHVIAASDFLVKLHSLPEEVKVKFNPASTNGLSLKNYTEDIQSRIAHLTKNCPRERCPSNIEQLLYGQVIPLSEKIIRDFMVHLSPSKISREFSLEQQALCFGDFGFHNILVSSS
mgnify:CR=1 FL=1